jgi:hypothetical protein
LPVFESLIPVLKDKKINLVVIFDSYFPYQDRLWDFFRRNNIRFLSMEDVVNRSDEIYIKNDRHLNSLGNRMFAEALFSLLKNTNAFQDHSLAGSNSQGTPLHKFSF